MEGADDLHIAGDQLLVRFVEAPRLESVSGSSCFVALSELPGLSAWFIR